MASCKNLLFAVLKNDKSSVKEILEQKSKFTPEQLGRMLWQAIRVFNFEIAEILIEAGADVNIKILSISGECQVMETTILHNLLKKRRESCNRSTLLTIERGADLNVHDKNYMSVFTCALMYKAQMNIIEALMRRGANYRHDCLGICLFQHPEKTKIIALYLDNDFGKKIISLEDIFISAVEYDQPEIVQLLIEKYEFNVNKSILSKLPLYRAVTGGIFPKSSADIAELLIRAGAKVNLLSDSEFGQEYPIHSACRRISVSNIRVLLRHGADINLVNDRGQTPFSLIDSENDELLGDALVEVVKHLAILISKGKTVNDNDLDRINKRDFLRQYFNRCLDELRNMKEIKITEDFSFLSFFCDDVKELLFETRKYNFLDTFNVAQWEIQFPIFHLEMYLQFKNLNRWRKFYGEREKALLDSLEHILPDLPLERIVYMSYLGECEF